MQYIMSFIWAIMLISMLAYVVGSILGVTTFDFVMVSIIAVIFTILLWIVAAIIPSESPRETQADQN